MTGVTDAPRLVPRRRACGLALLLALTAPSCLRAAEVATWSFSAPGRPGTRPGAVTIDDRDVRVDLSALPKGVAVIRATFRALREPSIVRGGLEEALTPVRVVASGGTLLRLRPPRFLDFDATEAVRSALSSGRPTAAFRVESFPGWKRQSTRLDLMFLSTQALADRKQGPRCVRDLEAHHLEGQTFLSWRQPEAGLGREEATVGELRAAREKVDEESETRYRIYRSRKPITLETMADAELIDEVDSFTAWNGEFHGMETEPTKPARRHSVRDGEPPVPPDAGIYVHDAATADRVFYLVSVAHDGEEGFESLASVGPVDEAPGPGHPVLQRIERPEEFMYVKRPRLEYYVRWEAPPRANTPSRPFDYLVGIPAGRSPRETGSSESPLCIGLHCWGGSLEGGYGWWYGAADGAMFLATNQIPYDWWASYNECLGTLKPFSEGVSRDYTPTRVWSFVQWMRGRWRIDAGKIFLGGSSMGGSGVSHWIRHGDRFSYGISWVGVHIPRETPQFRGSYENVVGRVEWNLPHESGLPIFDWLDGARWLRDNPTAETAFLAYSNGKNDPGIGWRQAVEFTTALQETRRPHLFVWGQGGHGQRAYFPTPEGGGDNVTGGLDIRSDRSLPAFTRSSLDDDPGDGDPSRGAPEGQVNLYTRWDAGAVVDEPGRWVAVVWLIPDAPRAEATVDVTPRRCRAFRPVAGAKLSWRVISVDGGEEAHGKAVADRWGLVTIERVPISKARRRLEVSAGGER